MNLPRSLAPFGALALVSSLSAQTLAQYTFGTGSNNANATTTGANVTPGVFSRGAGLGSMSYSTAAGAPSPRSIFVTGAQVDEEISSTSTDWLGFTVTATAGNELNLTNLSFYYAYTNLTGTISNSATFDVRSSVDGYATSIASYTPAIVNSSTPVWVQASIGLSSVNYQGLDSITFRIFLNDGAVTSGDTQLRLDTVTLSGISAAPIPEPASAAALAGLCGLGFVAARRRRAG